MCHPRERYGTAIRISQYDTADCQSQIIKRRTMHKPEQKYISSRSQLITLAVLFLLVSIALAIWALYWGATSKDILIGFSTGLLAGAIVAIAMAVIEDRRAARQRRQDEARKAWEKLLLTRAEIVAAPSLEGRVLMWRRPQPPRSWWGHPPGRSVPGEPRHAMATAQAGIASLAPSAGPLSIPRRSAAGWSSPPWPPRQRRAPAPRWQR